MQKFISFLVWSLLLLLLILVFQNLDPVTIRLLFRNVDVPAALLIGMSWLAGALTARPLTRMLMKTVRKDSQVESASTAAGTTSSPQSPESPASS